MKTVDTSRYNHIDHGYTLTAHKAQGITADRALIHLDSQQKGVNNRNAFYVDVSRARHEVKIYTDDRERVGSAVGHWQTKLSGDDFELQREQSGGENLRQERHEKENTRASGPSLSLESDEKNLNRDQDHYQFYEHADIQMAEKADVSYQPGEREIEQRFSQEWDSGRNLTDSKDLDRSISR